MAVRFDMVGLFVSDMPAMVAFYRDVLGLETDWDGQSTYAEFNHAGIRFSMYARRELPGLLGKEPGYPTGINGTFELAIDYPHFEDVDREYARIVAAGGRPVLAPRDEPWGMRSSYVADPDGNLIEVGSWNKGTGGE
jgi:catechol 2,3-dioxygenase-like lactoylglutathione lyase family enzyme